VVELVGEHALHDTELVGHPLQVRDRVGQFDAACAAPPPRPPRAEQFGRAAGEGELLAGEELGRAVLPVVFDKRRRVVVEVEVRR
jgi:hypothetical protein